MKNKLVGVIIALVIILAIFLLLVWLGGSVFKIERLMTGENPMLRFVFVIVGLLIALGVYLGTKDSPAWEVGTRQVVWMSIGAALYAIFSWLFNGTVFIVPSISQVALRPAIAIPVFFGYAFGPIVGFFSGAVGNMFGDALTGFGLYPQWSIANGLVGFIAGLPLLFKDKKKSLDSVLIAGGVLTLLATILYFLNRSELNQMIYPFDQPVSLFAGISILVGFVLVVIVRFAFGKDLDLAASVTWGMLGNILGIGFAAVSDIWINGYSLPSAIVGEFLPAAGPNLIFIAILVPLLVVAYRAVQRQSGR
jgi:uncharacterized membrane protein